MPLNQIVFIFVLGVITGLGIFVLLKNPANPINKRFCIFSLVVSIWIFFIFSVIRVTDPSIASFRLKLVFSAAFFIPPAFFSFSAVFPDGIEKSINRYFGITFFLLSLLGALLTISSSLTVERVTFVEQMPQARYGPLFHVFWCYFITCMMYSFYILYKKSIRFHGIKRLQIQYVYFGVAISVFLGGLTNFLLPVLGVWQVEMFVPLVSVPIPITVAYAIVRYHLMDISLIIKRSTIYGILSVVLCIVYFAVGMTMNYILPVSGDRYKITTVVTTVAMILTFIFFKEFIQNIVEKTLFHTRYSHSKILSDSTVMFSSIHDLNRLLHFAMQYLYDSVGIDQICILLKEEKTDHFSPKAKINFPSAENLLLFKQSFLVTWLSNHRTVLSSEQLHRFSSTEEDRLLEDAIASLRAEMCIPVARENELFGIILLGKKVSKKIYTQEDILMFLAFSGQLAMAIHNAQLYAGLKESKVYRDHILQSLKSGVVVVNTNEEVTLINNEARRILEIDDAGSSEKILRYLGEDIYKALRNTLKTNIEYNDIEIIIERNGRKVPCSITTTSLRTDTGEKLGALIIMYDLTEIKLLQAEKRHSERLAYLGSITANIAHEIKNPLVAINTYFQLLPYKKDDTTFHTDFQKIAIKEIGRINRIIEDSLYLAKPSDPVILSINPNIVIQDTINLFRNTFAEKDIEISIALEEQDCEIIADEDKLKQVLINILQNSIDALPGKNGRIRIGTCSVNDLSEFAKRAKEEQRRSVFFSFVSSPLRDRNGKKYFAVRISDNGTGIPSEKLTNIFEPFFTNKDKGTGLGLAMVYRIIKDHEGAIYVDSREGEGVDFYIFLPFKSSHISNIRDLQTKLLLNSSDSA